MRILLFILFSLSLFATDTLKPKLEKEKYTNPWFTGPLLAPDARCVGWGHVRVQPYFVGTDRYGTFNHAWWQQSTPVVNSYSFQPLITFGIYHGMDIQVSMQVLQHNRNDGAHSTRIGDISIVYGLQLARDIRNSWVPDIRATFGTIIPTGYYQRLSAGKKSTDITGSGAWEPALGLNFQKVYHLHDIHFLRLSIALNYIWPSTVAVRGLNRYGGGYGSDGAAHPGKKGNVDVAFEYNITRSFTFCSDFLVSHSGHSWLSGKKGFDADGNAIKSGGIKDSWQASIAPALQWNFSEKAGIIGGVWYSLFDRQGQDFFSVMIAFNILH